MQIFKILVLLLGLSLQPALAGDFPAYYKYDHTDNTCYLISAKTKRKQGPTVHWFSDPEEKVTNCKKMGLDPKGQKVENYFWKYLPVNNSIKCFKEDAWEGEVEDIAPEDDRFCNSMTPLYIAWDKNKNKCMQYVVVAPIAGGSSPTLPYKEVDKENCEKGFRTRRLNRANLSTREEFYKPYIKHFKEISCASFEECTQILGEEGLELVQNFLELYKQLAKADENLVNNDDQEELVQDIKDLIADCTQEAEEIEFNKSKEIALKELTEEFIQNSSELKRDANFFHWFPAIYSGIPSSSFLSGESIPGRNHLRSLQNNFFSSDYESGTGMFGRGLYASIDPWYTSEYGSTMARIKISKGSRYLSAKDAKSGNGETELRISKKTNKTLVKAGCHLDSREAGDGETIFVEKYAFSAKKRCRKIFNQAVKNADIKFFVYDYGSSRTSQDNCPNYKPYDADDYKGGIRNEAIVLANVEFNSENTHFYTTEQIESRKVHLESSDPEEQKFAKYIKSKGDDHSFNDSLFLCNQ